MQFPGVSAYVEVEMGDEPWAQIRGEQQHCADQLLSALHSPVSLTRQETGGGAW